jgi:hypothetical protein
MHPERRTAAERAKTLAKCFFMSFLPMCLGTLGLPGVESRGACPKPAKEGCNRSLQSYFSGARLALRS